ncbi:MAG: hypothetical protein LUG96_09675 [Tannerellaceae bacterium]|nr:hypothetical protein [Tannerellaceae bacterium]
MSHHHGLASVYLIEHLFYEDIVVTSLPAGIAGTCEVWSFSASILIIKPNFPFICFFRRQLWGEIEKKSGNSINDILQ